MSVIEDCPNRIEPIVIGRKLTKESLERVVFLGAAIQHLVGCVIIALTRKQDTSELAEMLHVYVDELAELGRKKQE
jgi:hypothetical protein